MWGRNPDRITWTNKIYLEGQDVAQLEKGGIRFKREYVFSIEDLIKIISMFEKDTRVRKLYENN